MTGRSPRPGVRGCHLLSLRPPPAAGAATGQLAVGADTVSGVDEGPLNGESTLVHVDEQDITMSEHEDRATVESSLRLGVGFEADERAHIVDTWSSLTRRLASFPDGAVELDLSVKERETPSQRMVLEARIAHEGHFVATSHRPDVQAALNEVRDDLIRQLTDAKNRTEPRNSRALRDSIRHD